MLYIVRICLELTCILLSTKTDCRKRQTRLSVLMMLKDISSQ